MDQAVPGSDRGVVRIVSVTPEMLGLVDQLKGRRDDHQQEIANEMSLANQLKTVWQAAGQGKATP